MHKRPIDHCPSNSGCRARRKLDFDFNDREPCEFTVFLHGGDYGTRPDAQRITKPGGESFPCWQYCCVHIKVRKGQRATRGGPEDGTPGGPDEAKDDEKRGSVDKGSSMTPPPVQKYSRHQPPPSWTCGDNDDNFSSADGAQMDKGYGDNYSVSSTENDDHSR